MIHPMMTMDDQNKIIDIVSTLSDDAIILEYGGGGSTLMLANLLRNKQRLITVEHNVEWYHRIKQEFEKMPANHYSQIYLRTPDADASVWPFGHYYEETPYSCDDYIHATNIDIEWNKVECVLVDGFVRGAVLAVLTTKLNPGVTVMLHDYEGRENWYSWAVRLYNVISLPSGNSSDRTPDGHLCNNSLLVMRT